MRFEGPFEPQLFCDSILCLQKAHEHLENLIELLTRAVRQGRSRALQSWGFLRCHHQGSRGLRGAGAKPCNHPARMQTAPEPHWG